MQRYGLKSRFARILMTVYAAEVALIRIIPNNDDRHSSGLGLSETEVAYASNHIEHTSSHQGISEKIPNFVVLDRGLAEYSPDQWKSDSIRD